jgi:hypothetical protein
MNSARERNFKEGDDITEAQAEEGRRRPAVPATPSSEPSQRPVPRLSSDAVIDRVFQAATNAMRSLDAHRRRVEDFLAPPSGTPASSPAAPAGGAPASSSGASLNEIIRTRINQPRPRPTPEELEIQFANAALGHRVPERVVREGDFSAIPYLQSLNDSRISSYASDIVGNWLPSIVYPDITAGMDRTPATICSFTSPEHMTGAQIFAELQMISALGAYVPESNAIIIPSEILSFSEADARHVVLHEELHYASYLGGGSTMRARDEDGNPLFFTNPPFSWSKQEGLTELTAQEICRERGFVPNMVGYPAEVITCYYMEQLLGEGGRDILRSAYLSGDFTEVRSRLDAALGAGTFDELMFRRDGADALHFLLARMDERGIDHSGWDANPIVIAARAKLAEAH